MIRIYNNYSIYIKNFGYAQIPYRIVRSSSRCSINPSPLRHRCDQDHRRYHRRCHPEGRPLRIAQLHVKRRPPRRRVRDRRWWLQDWRHLRVHPRYSNHGHHHQRITKGPSIMRSHRRWLDQARNMGWNLPPPNHPHQESLIQPPLELLRSQHWHLKRHRRLGQGRLLQLRRANRWNPRHRHQRMNVTTTRKFY